MDFLILAITPRITHKSDLNIPMIPVSEAMMQLGTSSFSQLFPVFTVSIFEGFVKGGFPKSPWVSILSHGLILHNLRYTVYPYLWKQTYSFNLKCSDMTPPAASL